MQLTDAPSSLPQQRLALRNIGLWFVLVALASITMLHYLTDVHLIPYHSIYRSLYYLPIAVAAVRYGRRGGVLTAIATSALYLPHVYISWGTMPGDSFNDLLENVVFLFVGAFAGSLADAERRQRQLAQMAALQLAEANTQLHTQANLAERMRASVESILESLDSGVVTLDNDRQMMTANRAAQEWLREITAAHPTLIHDYLTSATPGYQQHIIASRTLGLHDAPLVGAHGETIGTVLVLDDLTERRALEVQIQRAERLAALGRLAGGLAHEIRNPLAIVRAAAQILHQQLEPHAQLGEYTRVIQTEIDRVDRLIEQLLSYSRPRPLSRGPVDVGALVDRAVALTHAYAAQHGVRVEQEVAMDLPSLEGDAELLHQALVNLILNAVQATPAEGVVHVRAAAAIHERRQIIELIVRDTGRGIPTDDLSRIFDPFFTTRSDGTGLGLSIVQQIVQDHQGGVDVQSQPDRGTEFALRLPVASSSQISSATRT